MARYEIEQYELHVATYQVVAESTAESIKRLFDGDGELVEAEDWFETFNEKGLPIDENRQLAEDLRKLGLQIKESVIPSIRSVRRLEVVPDDDGTPNSTMRLIDLATTNGVVPDDLDELVHDCAGAEAAEINNRGLAAQIELLVGHLGDMEVRKTLERLGEKGS